MSVLGTLEIQNRGKTLFAPVFASVFYFFSTFYINENIDYNFVLFGHIEEKIICLRTIYKANLKIFLFPLIRPCYSGIGRSVRKLFFLTS